MPPVQDWSLDMLICSPASYHCTTDAPIYLVVDPIMKCTGNPRIHKINLESVLEMPFMAAPSAIPWYNQTIKSGPGIWPYKINDILKINYRLTLMYLLVFETNVLYDVSTTLYIIILYLYMTNRCITNALLLDCIILNFGCTNYLYTFYKVVTVLKHHLPVSLSSHKQAKVRQNNAAENFHEM